MRSIKHQEKKETILKHGIELMWKCGYNGTSVKDIVQAAGIPKGSFYFYFDSKEHFALQAVRSYIEDDDTLQLLENQSILPINRLTQVLQKRIDRAVKMLQCRQGCFAANLAQEMSDTNDSIRQVVAEVMQRGKKAMVKCITDAQSVDQIRNTDQPENIAAMLEMAWHGALLSMKIEQESAPLYLFQRYALEAILQASE